MRKIALLLLLNCGFIGAQTKTVVTQYGEKVTISPNVNNGLTATNGFIQLGGALTQKSVLTTTSAFTLALAGLQTGVGSDNILVTNPANGVIRTISALAFTPYYWGVKGNVGTNPSTDFLGTTDGADLLFKTDNTERIRIGGITGFTGIGLQKYPEYSATPKYMLDVVDDVHIASKRVGFTSGRLIFENAQVDWGGTQGSGIYMLDGQDNGLRREWFFGKPYNSAIDGSGKKSAFVLKSMQTDVLNYGLADSGSGTYHLYVDALNNRIGIGTINPGAALEVAATADPLKLTGLQAGATTEKVLTVDNNGVVHKTLSFSKGIVQCDTTGILTINDPNITATSVVMLTYLNPTNNNSNSTLMEVGTRVPGVSFSIKTLPLTAFSVQYLIVN